MLAAFAELPPPAAAAAAAAAPRARTPPVVAANETRFAETGPGEATTHDWSPAVVAVPPLPTAGTNVSALPGPKAKTQTSIIVLSSVQRQH